MQDALPVFVLGSEAEPTPMNDSPANPQPNPAALGPSDEQLMLAFSQGSADAFSELFSRYKQPLFGFFRRRLADVSPAEELTQETLLVLLRSASRYQPRVPFSEPIYLSLHYRFLKTGLARLWHW